MNSESGYRLYLPGIGSERNKNIAIVAADVREDHTVFGYFRSANGTVNLVNESTYPTKDFSAFSEMAAKFIQEHRLTDVERLSVAVPGPVINASSAPSRLNWEVNAEEIKNALQLEKVYLLNDLEGFAYGLACISEDALIPIYKGENKPKGNVAILAPGNGLGESGLFFDGEYLRPFASEGGHSEFSPRTNTEVEFYQFLNHIYGIVSWESVLSKKGLFNIYRFLRDVQRHPEPEWLGERLSNGDFMTELFKAAVEDDVQICKISMNTFLEFLAREANNLALKLKATGGLIITGEIPLAMKNYMDKDRFYQKFKISDKMENLLKEIPLYLAVDEKAGLKGAAIYAAYSEI